MDKSVLFANLKPIVVPSTDHASLTLPDVSPTVIIARRVPRAPWLTLHCTDVSEFHSDDSQLVSPALARPEYCMPPKPMPCNVTDADPVPARLPSRCLLRMEPSNEKTWLKLPIS